MLLLSESMNNLILMGTTYACTCPLTGEITYCSCGCNTCEYPCSDCPIWYWIVLGVGVFLGIVLGIIGFYVRRKRRLRAQNRSIEINLNPNVQAPPPPRKAPKRNQTGSASPRQAQTNNPKCYQSKSNSFKYLRIFCKLSRNYL